MFKKKKLIFSCITIVIVLLIYLSIDAFFGKYFFVNNRIEKEYRISHEIFHHTLKANFRTKKAYWTNYYSLCTDHSGFKNSCSMSNQKNKDFDLAFIGDSVTEGIGLEFEDTFVGKYSSEKKDIKIANLAVSSYSPKIYYSKINYLLKNNYKFKHIIIFIDPSDIQDDGLIYKFINDEKVINRTDFTEDIAERYESKKIKFPISKFLRTFIKNRLNVYFNKIVNKDHNYEIKNFAFFLEKNNLYNRFAWTFDSTVDNFYGPNGINGAIDESIVYMKKLTDLLKKNNIKFSVAVYPLPPQMMFDNLDSAQVKIWKDFCAKNLCDNFINLFDSLFSIQNGDVFKFYKEYFIYGDVHFNKKGNQLIVDELLKLKFN